MQDTSALELPGINYGHRVTDAGTIAMNTPTAMTWTVDLLAQLPFQVALLEICHLVQATMFWPQAQNFKSPSLNPCTPGSKRPERQPQTQTLSCQVKESRQLAPWEEPRICPRLMSA